MKTIKIFLASSEELEDDRNAFGNLVRKLNKSYEKRGIHLELFEWEDYDAAINDRRKQDEYNDEVRASDMFLAVFHRVAGKYTIEEFDVATEEFLKRGLPKRYVYCKEILPGDVESDELKEFKRRLFEEMGHYWSRYANRDTMQLHFVMQLQLVENNSHDALKVENGTVMLDGQPIARMANLPFAGLNEDFQRMSARLAELPEMIEKARSKVDKYPDDEDFRDDLQKLLNEYNKLKDDFAENQNNLFNTAKRIAQLQGEHITDRMRRAIEAFDKGRVRDANIILSEAERDAREVLQEYKQSKEITEQKRQNVIKSVEEILLKTSTMMADLSIHIEDRINRTEELYAHAYAIAQECDYEKERCKNLLSKYTGFLDKYAKYNKALGLMLHLLHLCEELYGLEHPDTAKSYNHIGGVYCALSDYAKALVCYHKSLAIREQVLGLEHPDTATSYNNIGLVYFNQGEYAEALEYYHKALTIRENLLGLDHPDTAISYNHIGGVYYVLGEYAKALEYYHKSLAIFENVLGLDHPDTATTYNNIGLVYFSQSDYTKALEYYYKSFAIREQVLGLEHPDTARSYNNIGGVHYARSEYAKALEYYHKSLIVFENLLGLEHPDTATSYNNIGLVYFNQDDYAKALEYYHKSLAIREKTLGLEHPDTATSYDNIGGVYFKQGDYAEALEYYHKAYAIFENVLGLEHPDTARSYNNIKQGDYAKALENYHKTMAVKENKLVKNHSESLTIKDKISKVSKPYRSSDIILSKYIDVVDSTSSGPCC